MPTRTDHRGEVVVSVRFARSAETKKVIETYCLLRVSRPSGHCITELHKRQERAIRIELPCTNHRYDKRKPGFATGISAKRICYPLAWEPRPRSWMARPEAICSALFLLKSSAVETLSPSMKTPTLNRSLFSILNFSNVRKSTSLPFF